MATSTGDWIEAAPFRAHLRHLMAVAELTYEEAATVTGLSTRAVLHILEGRAGRPQRRVSPDTAHRLLQVSAADVGGLRWHLAPAEPARAAYAELQEAGWSEAEVATRVRVPLGELAALSVALHCNRMLTVRLVSLARGLPLGQPAPVPEKSLSRAA